MTFSKMPTKDDVNVFDVPEMTVEENHPSDHDHEDVDTVFEKAEQSYNSVLRIVGSPGRYQILLLILLGLGTVPATMNDFVAVFYSTPSKATYCKIPEHLTRNGLVPDCIYRFANLTDLEPPRADDFVLAKIDPDYCRIIPTNSSLSVTEEDIQSCRGWPCMYEVVHTFSHEREWTVLAQWALACQMYWQFTLSMVVYFSGAFVGTLTFEMLCSKLGYKSNMWLRFAVCLFLCVAFGFEKAFWLFVLLRFLLGAVGHGVRYSCMRLMFDLLPSDQRLGVITILSVCSGFGLILLGLSAYAIKDWRFILFGTILFCVVGMVYQWMVPESLRWLMAHSQVLQAQQTFYKILAGNKQFVPAGVETLIAKTTNNLMEAQKNSQSWRVLLRTSGTCRQFMALITLWFMVSLVNYGILLSIPNLGGNVYGNVIISGVLDIFATVGFFVLIRRLQLCRVLFVSMFVGGMLCLAGGLIPGGFEHLHAVEITRTCLILAGRIGVGTCSWMLLEMLFRVVPVAVQSNIFGLYSAVGLLGALVSSMFVHMMRFNLEIPVVLFGIFSVCSAFLTFALPSDETKEIPLEIKEDLPDPDFNNPMSIGDDEQLVFEQLPDITRSPYVL